MGSSAFFSLAAARSARSRALASRAIALSARSRSRFAVSVAAVALARHSRISFAALSALSRSKAASSSASRVSLAVATAAVDLIAPLCAVAAASSDGAPSEPVTEALRNLTLSPLTHEGGGDAVREGDQRALRKRERPDEVRV